MATAKQAAHRAKAKKCFRMKNRTKAKLSACLRGKSGKRRKRR